MEVFKNINKGWYNVRQNLSLLSYICLTYIVHYGQVKILNLNCENMRLSPTHWYLSPYILMVKYLLKM